MGLRSRIERLLDRLCPADPEGVRLEAHWRAVHEEQVAWLEKLGDAIPAEYQKPVFDALTPYEERLADPQDHVWATYRDHPEFGGVRPPAVVRCVADLLHDFGEMPEPVPAELLAALFAHPGADLDECRRCGVHLPYRQSRKLGPRADGRGDLWTKNRQHFAACPCCGEPTRTDHPTSGLVDDPNDVTTQEPAA